MLILHSQTLTLHHMTDLKFLQNIGLIPASPTCNDTWSQTYKGIEEPQDSNQYLSTMRARLEAVFYLTSSFTVSLQVYHDPS